MSPRPASTGRVALLAGFVALLMGGAITGMVIIIVTVLPD